MLNSILERRFATVSALLPCLLLMLGLEQTAAQQGQSERVSSSETPAAFEYETLRSPVSGLRGVVAIA